MTEKGLICFVVSVCCCVWLSSTAVTLLIISDQLQLLWSKSLTEKKGINISIINSFGYKYQFLLISDILEEWLIDGSWDVCGSMGLEKSQTLSVCVYHRIRRELPSEQSRDYTPSEERPWALPWFNKCFLCIHNTCGIPGLLCLIHTCDYCKHTIVSEKQYLLCKYFEINNMAMLKNFLHGTKDQKKLLIYSITPT